MRLFKFAAAGMTAASMLAATSAMAAQPTHSAALLAPTGAQSLRVATPLKHKSNQSDSGSPVIGYALAAVVAAGIVGATIAATDNNSDYKTPASPG